MISFSVYLFLLLTVLKLANGRQYFCHRFPHKEATRKDADLACRGRGMALPLVEDLPTVHRIANHCNIKNRGQGFWVDAKRELKLFRWSTGRVINKKNPIWHKHNPSNDGPCIEFHKGGSKNVWALNDVSCNTKRFVVCEQRPQIRTALKLADGRKFFCHNYGLTRNDADLHCRSRGMTLPFVKDLRILKEIAYHCNIKDNGVAFWVDAKRDHPSKIYRWSTGSVIDNKDPIWHIGNPGYDGPCVEFLYSHYRPRNYQGIYNRWAINDVTCNQERSVVCEQDPHRRGPSRG